MFLSLLDFVLRTTSSLSNQHLETVLKGMKIPKLRSNVRRPMSAALIWDNFK